MNLTVDTHLSSGVSWALFHVFPVCWAWCHVARRSSVADLAKIPTVCAWTSALQEPWPNESDFVRFCRVNRPGLDFGCGWAEAEPCLRTCCAVLCHLDLRGLGTINSRHAS